MRRKISRNPGTRKRRILASVLISGALIGCSAHTDLFPSDSGADAIMHDGGPDSGRIRDSDVPHDSGHESGIDSDIIYDSDLDSGPVRCAPPDSCMTEVPTVVTLGEGESITIRGRTAEVLSIDEDVGEPSFPPGGGPGVCSVTNEQVTLRVMDTDGTLMETVTLAEGVCYAYGCMSLLAEEILEAVGPSDGGPCPIYDETARLIITLPSG